MITLKKNERLKKKRNKTTYKINICFKKFKFKIVKFDKL
jgi:hypothetical protein